MWTPRGILVPRDPVCSPDLSDLLKQESKAYHVKCFTCTKDGYLEAKFA